MQMEIVECYTVRNPGTPEAYIDPKSWSYQKWEREKGFDYLSGQENDKLFLIAEIFTTSLFIIPREILEAEGMPVYTREYVLEQIRSYLIEVDAYKKTSHTVSLKLEREIVDTQTKFLNFLTSKGIHLS